MPEDKLDRALREIRGETDRLRQQAERQEEVNRRNWEEISRQSDERMDLGISEAGLFARISLWDRLPDKGKEHILEQVSELVEKAKAGNTKAQEVLGNIQSKMAKAKIVIPSLPFK